MTSRIAASSGGSSGAVGDYGALWLRRRGDARSRAIGGPQLCSQAVLAALNRGGGAEGHLFLLPGRIERGQVLGVLVGFAEQGLDDRALRLPLSEEQRAG